MGGKQIIERSHRMGSVSLWESPGTPMIDIVYIVPTTINTGKELVQSSVGICLEIVDDLLASIFGVAGHTLTPSQVQRPKHALLDFTFGDKIIKDLLRMQQNEDEYFDEALAFSQAQKMIVAMRRAKQSELQTRMVTENLLVRECLRMANKASVLGASQGKKILHLKPKKELREPDAKTKKTIERLYEPKEEKVSEVNKLLRKQKTFKYGGSQAFNTQSVRFGPVRSGNTKLLDTKSAQMYNRGHALHTGRDSQNESSHKSKYSGKKKRSAFGYSAMSNIPLKDMNLARSVIDIIREISDACCTGKAQKHLKRLHGQFPKNLKTEMDLSMYELKAREPKNLCNLDFLKIYPLIKRTAKLRTINENQSTRIKRKWKIGHTKNYCKRRRGSGKPAKSNSRQS